MNSKWPDASINSTTMKKCLMKAEANTVVPALQTKAGTPILLTGKKAVRGVPKGKYLAQY